jgi:hypothetical protein
MAVAQACDCNGIVQRNHKCANHHPLMFLKAIAPEISARTTPAASDWIEMAFVEIVAVRYDIGLAPTSSKPTTQ